MPDSPKATTNTSDVGPRTPAWVQGAGHWTAFWRGGMRALLTPGWILMVSSAGFGVIAQDAGFSLTQAFLVMALYFGLPAQVAVADQIARDASFWACALAVTLTGVRLLPMTVALVPFLGASGRKSDHGAGDQLQGSGLRTGIAQVIAVHFIAVTAWFEGMRALPALPDRLRAVHFIGVGVGLTLMTLVGTAVGFLMVEVVPPMVGAVLLFVSPAYFLLALIDAGRLPSDKLAIGLGCGLSPIFYLVVPELDLLITGLLGGTLAYVWRRHFQGSNHEASGDE